MGSRAAFRPPLKVKTSGGFILLLAVLLFLDEEGFIAAAFPAVAVHELCHALTMRAFGARPVRLSATAAGFSMDYAGIVSDTALALTALAGPLGGAGFALLCARLGQLFGSDYLLLCAGLGFLLSCFNLLPALPLDGGVALDILLRRTLGEHRAQRVINALGLLVMAAVLGFGAWLMHRGFGAALLLSGLWLAVFRISQACKCGKSGIQ